VEQERDLRIRSGSSRKPSDPGFGALVQQADGNSAGALAVPVEVADILDTYAIVTASAFLAYARTFPDAIALELRLTKEDARQKSGELASMLKGHVAPELLGERKPLNVGFGVIVD